MEDGLHDFPGGRPLSHHRSHRVQSLGAASRDFPADHHRDPEADVYFPARLCQLNGARRTHPGEVPRSWVLRLPCGEDKSEQEAVTEPLALHVPVGTSSTCLPGLDVCLWPPLPFLVIVLPPSFLPLSSLLFLLLYFSCLLLLLIPFRPRVSLPLSFRHFCPLSLSLFSICLVLELPVTTWERGVTLLEARKVRGPLTNEGKMRGGKSAVTMALATIGKKRWVVVWPA